jgi:hypothetical protein
MSKQSILVVYVRHIMFALETFDVSANHLQTRRLIGLKSGVDTGFLAGIP